MENIALSEVLLEVLVVLQMQEFTVPELTSRPNHEGRSRRSNTYPIVCVLCFFPSILGVKFVGCTSRGHTGFLIHLPSAVHAFIILARRIQPFLSLVDREVDLYVLTIKSLKNKIKVPNGGRTIKSLVHKIRLHSRRGKGMAESFSREKLRHASQKEGG